MKSGKVFDHSILKVNNDGLLSANPKKLNTTLSILRDNDKQFLIKTKKLQILDNKIDDYIKKHYDEPLLGHPGVSKMLQLLRQRCQFSHMQQFVKTYIKRCFSC